ncbi:MAG: Uncharacterized protein FD189_175 [Elusimicrobia bacterium]|nr:MAG: Uncharacterized protein FD154_327 [Elusimicrobiota bacterium]KAF0158183.1 MAG: Uncharacterized protein FD189_175 [Elusimicrobiota bacterium]
MRITPIFISLAMAAALAACAGAGRSGGAGPLEAVEAEGYADTGGKDPSSARPPALAAAERAALKKAAALFSDDPAAVDAVLSRHSYYVRKSKILSEKRMDNFLSLRARVWIYIDRVRHAVAPSVASSAGPRLVLAVSGDSGAGGETAFRAAALSSMGASFVPAQAGEDTAALTGRAAASGARAAVSVRFSIRPLDAAVGGGLAQASAEASAVVIDARGGGNLAEFSVAAAGMGQDRDAAAAKALAEAGAALGRELGARLGGRLKGEDRGFTLRFSGAPGIDIISSLAAAVEGISTVRRVAVVSYAEGEAELAVYSDKMSPEEFASLVLRAAGDSLVIDGIEASEVAFRYIR